MKRLLLSICLAWSATGFAQTTYMPSARNFIAYDSPVIALTHCTLADVIGLKALPDQTVILRKGVIAAIGAAANTPVPKDAQVIDCTGKSLLPGLVLLHEHMYYPALSVNPMYIHYKQLPATFPKLYLACGATTIRTAGSVEPSGPTKAPLLSRLITCSTKQRSKPPSTPPMPAA